MNIRIQVLIKEQTEVGEFQDALYFTEEEYASLSEKDIQKMIDTRIENWVNQVQNPPIPEEPTKEDLESQKIELQKHIDEVELKISEIE
jgi:hypothetical protein